MVSCLMGERKKTKEMLHRDMVTGHGYHQIGKVPYFLLVMYEVSSFLSIPTWMYS